MKKLLQAAWVMLNPPEGDSGGFCFKYLWSDFRLGCFVTRRSFLTGEGEMPVWLLQRSSYLTDRSGMQLASCSYSGWGLKQPPAQQCVGWGTWCLSCPGLHCQDFPRPLCLQAGLKERAPVVGVIESAATEKVWHILGDQTGLPKCVERVGRCCSEATVTFERPWRSGGSLMAGERLGLHPSTKSLGL